MDPMMLMTGTDCVFTNYCAEKEKSLKLEGKAELDWKIKFYRCKKCGKVLVVVHDTMVPTVCCGEVMEELVPCTMDGAVEKHVPVIHQSGNKVTVSVGEQPHPMTREHYIMWIVLMTDKGIQKKFLCPSEEPVAHFMVLNDESIVGAYAFCNIHFLWKNN